MAKAEWGTKRTCPKCGTRFYDLGKGEPVSCIDCGNSWTPEPVLKTKQPIVVEEKVVKVVDEDDEVDVDDEDDIEIDDEDDVLADVSLDDDDDDEVSTMVDTKLTDDDL